MRVTCLLAKYRYALALPLPAKGLPPRLIGDFLGGMKTGRSP